MDFLADICAPQLSSADSEVGQPHHPKVKYSCLGCGFGGFKMHGKKTLKTAMLQHVIVFPMVPFTSNNFPCLIPVRQEQWGLLKSILNRKIPIDSPVRFPCEELEGYTHMLIYCATSFAVRDPSSPAQAGRLSHGCFCKQAKQARDGEDQGGKLM